MNRGSIFLLICGIAVAVSISTLSTPSRAMIMQGHDGTSTPQCAGTPDNGRCYTGKRARLDTRVKNVFWKWTGPPSPCVLRVGSTDTFSSVSVVIAERRANDDFEWVEIGLSKQSSLLHPTSTTPGAATPTPLHPYAQEASQLFAAMGKVAPGATVEWRPHPIAPMPDAVGKNIQL